MVTRTAVAIVLLSGPEAGVPAEEAQYELARLKRARGEVGAEELDRARRAHAEAPRKFQVFWNTKLPTD